jgi:TonB family protein
VSIDGAAPFTTPSRQEGIAVGAHHVRVTLAGYQSVELETQVKGAGTTDLGTIKLESSLGTLELASSPNGLEFAVRTAADPTGKPLRSGRTPATLAGVPRGDYVVTFSRPGCRDHVEKVSVEKEATFPVATKYLDGGLELTSDPTGAWVDRDGARLGTTPLVLHDMAPRTVSFEITLPGYDPTPISCEVPEGQTLKVNAKLLRKDRTFSASEVKSLPVSYESPQPELSPGERKMDAEVLISLVVQRDGTVVDVQVERATDDDIGRRCAAAVARWKFRPGTAPDNRTVDVRIEMPFKFLAGNS